MINSSDYWQRNKYSRPVRTSCLWMPRRLFLTSIFWIKTTRRGWKLQEDHWKQEVRFLSYICNDKKTLPTLKWFMIWFLHLYFLLLNDLHRSEDGDDWTITKSWLCRWNFHLYEKIPKWCKAAPFNTSHHPAAAPGQPHGCAWQLRVEECSHMVLLTEQNPQTLP